MATSNPVDISAMYEQLRKAAAKFNANALMTAPAARPVPELFIGIQKAAEPVGKLTMTIGKQRAVEDNPKAVKVTFQSGGDVFDEENRFDLGGDITPPSSALKRVMVQYDCSIEDAQCYLDLREEGHSQYVAAVNAGLIDPAS